MIKFTYKAMEAGWALVTVTDGRATLNMDITTVFRDIGMLAYCVRTLLSSPRYERAVEAQFGWMKEPGEYRWLLRAEGNMLHIHILRLEKYGPIKGSIERGETLFEADCPLLKVAIQVKTAMRETLEELGAEEYKRRTRVAFPQDEYEALLKGIRDEQYKQKQTARKS